jgi:hypothetical protein
LLERLLRLRRNGAAVDDGQFRPGHG